VNALLATLFLLLSQVAQIGGPQLPGSTLQPASVVPPTSAPVTDAPAAANGLGHSSIVDMIDKVARDLDHVTGDVATINQLVGMSPDRLARAELYRPLHEKAARFDEVIGRSAPVGVGRLEIFHGYVPVFIAAFLVTVIATPIMRRLALANGIIDRPSEARKAHRIPVAYLGGVAVFLGIAAGILYSYLGTVFPGLMTFHPTQYLEEGAPRAVPISVLLGMTTIMLVGLLDDVVGVRPHVKVGGQLIAAAALAGSDVGVKVAEGVLAPLGRLLFNNPRLLLEFNVPFEIPVFGSHVRIDLIYWAGTAVIAIFVLGACNASNLIDGLDGLLAGVTGIANMGLLMISLILAVRDDGPLDGARIVICMAVVGACLGFLPHNFNPATIFLGDCGSLLLGFSTIVVILTLSGENGQTHLVLAGLIIYAIPIIDTVLAIVRRKMAGKSISDADDQHLHHMLKRALGVKGAVLTLYGLGVGFAFLGVAMVGIARARSVYAVTLVFAVFIVVMAIKTARRHILEEQALHHANGGKPRAKSALPEPIAAAPATQAPTALVESASRAS
jgi:UDP-GlcNAc:undecaprenyl-phosphate GlcNAc-1-phosphate transferase